MFVGRRRLLYAALAAVPATCRRRIRGGSHGPPSGAMPGAVANVHGAMHGHGAVHGHAHAPPAAAPVRPLHPESLARFVDPLPLPGVLAPSGTRPDPEDPSAQLPFYRVTMAAADVRVHRDLPSTRFWTYEGTVPGPVIEARGGRPILVEWRNDLPEDHLFAVDHTLCGAEPDRPDVRAVVHVHGARVPPESDGYPEDWYTRGRSSTVRYPNRQDAATLWYHDHAIGIERLNQYAGLFGLYLLRDAAEDALDLPSGPHEIPLVLFDRLFDADGRLVYPTSGNPEAPWVTEFFGDVLLVNGKAFPFLDVEPRLYRFRVANASNSRVYYLSFGGRPFHQIGSDQGLLPAPVPLTELTLAPAERADLLVDFRSAAGTAVVLKSQAFELVQFRVGPLRGVKGAGNAARAGVAVPKELRAVPRTPASAAVRTRRLTLNEYEDPKTHTMLMLLNATRWHEPITEKPVLDSTEIWEFVNLTEDTHPIHLHLVRFQILDRQLFDADEFLTSGKMVRTGDLLPPAPNEAGWKDTVRVDPGTVTRIVIAFEGYVGRYVWHCHVLEHAANEMMRPFEVVKG